MSRNAPGVYTGEISYPLYSPAISTAAKGIVLTASKGPMNTPVLVTDEGTLFDKFGPASETHKGLYTGQRFLRQGNQLYVVRVGTYASYPANLVWQNAAETVNVLDISIPEDVGPGSWADDLKVDIRQDSRAGTYMLMVYFNDHIVETYRFLTIGPSNVAADTYLPTVVNAASKYISVALDDDGAAETDLLFSTTSVDNSQTFSGGQDGAPADPADVIGVVGAPPASQTTGMQIFRDKRNNVINLLAVPGRWEREIVVEAVSIAEDRADIRLLIDPPFGLSAQQVTDWHNGVLTGDAQYLLAALNSSYAEVAWPWVQIFDSYSNAHVWIPPSGHIAQRIAYTNKIAWPWYSYAGPNRGKLVDVEAIEHSATDGELELLCSNGNRINPIINFYGQGFVVWDQNTTLRSTSPLSQDNVRALMNYLERNVEILSVPLLQEPNDSYLWRSFRNAVEPVLLNIKNNRGVYDYMIVCDGTTNTPEVIGTYTMKALIMVQPELPAKKIFVQCIITPTGASFSEFLQG